MWIQKQAPRLITCSLPHSLMPIGFSLWTLTQSWRKQVEILFLPYCSTARASFRGMTLKEDSTTWTFMSGNLTTTGPSLLIRPECLVLSSLHLRRSRPQISRHSNLLRFMKNPPPIWRCSCRGFARLSCIYPFLFKDERWVKVIVPRLDWGGYRR